MRFITLTGGIATGKSTVSKVLARCRGTAVVDCDKLAFRLLQPGTLTYRRVVHRFGEQIVQPDGKIDRPKLGSIVFESPKQRKALDRITYWPLLWGMFRTMCSEWIANRPHTVVLDSPLLFERYRFLTKLSTVVVVACPHDTQLQRLMKRNGYTQREAELRIAAQMPMEKKIAAADVVIDNSGSLFDTESQTHEVIDALNLRKRRPRPLLSCTWPMLPDLAVA